jgi:hypothetical protein
MLLTSHLPTATTTATVATHLPPPLMSPNPNAFAAVVSQQGRCIVLPRTFVCGQAALQGVPNTAAACHEPGEVRRGEERWAPVLHDVQRWLKEVYPST